MQHSVSRRQSKEESQDRQGVLSRCGKLRWSVLAVCMLLAGFFGLRALGIGGEEASGDVPAAAAVQEFGEPWVQAIEDVGLCQRVVGENPEVSDAERTWAEPDPATWKQLHLSAPKTDGSFAKIRMVRSPDWLEKQRPEVGGTVDISVPECGIEGSAEVRWIGPCPPVQPGEGPVVTALFEHESAAVIDVHVEDLDAPIGCTANHPFWSEDRQDFVRADELQEGERLRTLEGLAHVTAIVPRAGPEPVYNLEVWGEHVYRVTSDGLLVHNGKLCDNIVYRVLRKNEDPMHGIFPKLPGSQYPGGINTHVLHGSKPWFRGDKWISTTKDLDVAKKWAEEGQRVVRIDLSKTADTIVETIDLTSKKVRNRVLRGVSSPNFAKESQEVLIEGWIRPEAISRVLPKGG